MDMAMQPLRRFEPQPAPRFAPMWARRAFILTGTAVLTAAGCYEMYQVLQVGGVTVLESIILALFVLLFAWIAFSFMSALAGFFVLLHQEKGRTRHRSQGSPARDPQPDRDAAADLQRGSPSCAGEIARNL